MIAYCFSVRSHNLVYVRGSSGRKPSARALLARPLITYCGDGDGARTIKRQVKASESRHVADLLISKPLGPCRGISWILGFIPWLTMAAFSVKDRGKNVNISNSNEEATPESRV